MLRSAKVRRVQVSLCQLDVRVRRGQPGLGGLLIIIINKIIMMMVIMMIMTMIFRVMTNVVGVLMMIMMNIHDLKNPNYVCKYPNKNIKVEKLQLSDYESRVRMRR